MTTNDTNDSPPRSGRFRFLSAAAIAVLTIAAAALLFRLFRPPKPPEHVEVVYPRIIAALPHLVAKQQKLYEKYNLVVTDRVAKSSAEMIQAVRANECDFLPAVSLVDVLNESVGKDEAILTIISTSRMRKDVPFDALIVPPGSPISSLRDLEGRRLGVFPGATSEACIRWFLRKNGVDVAKVTFQTVDPERQVESLLSGTEVDAIHAYEPERTKGLRHFSCRQLTTSIYAAISEPAVIGSSAIPTKLFEKRPEVAKALLAVWDDALEYIRTHEADARKLLITEFKYPEDVATECTWVDPTKTSELQFSTIENYVGILREMDPQQVKNGGLPSEIFLGHK